MVWTSANGPKCPVSPEDRDEIVEPSPVAWMVERESDRTFPRFYRTKAGADAMAACVTAWPAVKVTPLYAASAVTRPDRETL
jgi:hypothetical protein